MGYENNQRLENAKEFKALLNSKLANYVTVLINRLIETH